MLNQKPKKQPTRAFTCNLPVSFFKRIQKIANANGVSIKDAIVSMAERGISLWEKE